ncbi:MAG: hypothetical protein GY913_03615 [Proteobacteria bacterium]|nr:hypothetical protein [Pseudomonadota bacterium]MCP4915989.1 hypothetical protein [Pseudomonadota bacterium]
MLLLSLMSYEASAAWPPVAKAGDPIQVYVVGPSEPAMQQWEFVEAPLKLWAVGVWDGNSWTLPPDGVTTWDDEPKAGDAVSSEWCVLHREYPLDHGAGAMKATQTCTGQLHSWRAHDTFDQKTFRLATWPAVQWPSADLVSTDLAGLTGLPGTLADIQGAPRCSGTSPEVEAVHVLTTDLIVETTSCGTLVADRVDGRWKGQFLDYGVFAGMLDLPGGERQLLTLRGWSDNGDLQIASVYRHGPDGWVLVHETGFANP